MNGWTNIEYKVIALREDTPLPCALLRDGGKCGRPATGAYAWPVSLPGVEQVTDGLWTIQPVCESCAVAAAKVYGVAP